MSGNILIPRALAEQLSEAIQAGLEHADGMDSAMAPVNQASDGVAEPIFGGSKFRFGAVSLKELAGVKPELVEVVHKALALSVQDFMVFDGIRTRTEQAEHVRRGTSKTMKSKHLDGLAVDLVPVVAGKPVWEWERIYPIAYAMDVAASYFGCANHIRWGGAWDRTLADFGGKGPEAYRRECELYAARHPGKDFLDGPHFEWVD